MRETEIGNCSVCKNESIPVNRKYYHYGIKCDCHSPDHFEIVYHCSNCTPIPPKTTLVHIKPINNGQ